MSFQTSMHTIKINLARELRRKRKWQTYFAAMGITLCFFLVVGNVLGESSTPSETKTVAMADIAEPNGKVKGFTLTDERDNPKVSNWENSTGAVAAQPAAEKALKAAPQPEEEDTASLSEVDAARLAVNKFYSAINDGQLGVAYDKLSPEFQQSLPYPIFENGYKDVTNLDCEVKNTELLNSHSVRVDVQIKAFESGVGSTYFATCIVTEEDQDWSVSGVAQLAANL